jgi:hypothetical protein
VGSEAGFAFGSSFSWIARKFYNLLSYGLCLSHDTSNIEIYLCSGPYLAPACVAASWVEIIFSSVEGSVPIVWLRRPKIFLLVF